MMIKKLNFEAILLFLRGAALIIFGIVMLIWTQLSVINFIIAFGILSLVNGLAGILSALVSRKKGSNTWWNILADGIVSFLIGLLVLFLPGLTSLTALYLMAFWAIFMGFFLVISALINIEDLEKSLLTFFLGILSTLFGVFAILKPREGILVFADLIAFFAIFTGIGFSLLSYKAFSLSKIIEADLKDDGKVTETNKRRYFSFMKRFKIVNRKKEEEGKE